MINIRKSWRWGSPLGRRMLSSLKSYRRIYSKRGWSGTWWPGGSVLLMTIFLIHARRSYRLNWG